MCRTSVIKRKSVRDQKKVNKKNKNREVCEEQPGVLAFATQADRRFDTDGLIILRRQ